METVIRNTFKTLPVEICSHIYEYYKLPFLNDIRTAKKPTGMWLGRFGPSQKRRFGILIMNYNEPMRYLEDCRYNESGWSDVFNEKMTHRESSRANKYYSTLFYEIKMCWNNKISFVNVINGRKRLKEK